MVAALCNPAGLVNKLLFTPSSQPVKKNQPRHDALIALIRRQIKKRLEIEIIVPIRHVVVHTEGRRGHDWFTERARDRGRR